MHMRLLLILKTFPYTLLFIALFSAFIMSRCCHRVSFRGTHIDAFFRRASSAAHTNDRGLITVDLLCCTGAIARQVPEAGSEVLSRVIASGREVLTRGLMAGDDVLTRE
ncbi:hypothetical protein ED146_24100 [Escherichia coli]|nr:hypothetical protein [Escherichia coli]EEV6124343.1 hypothetical protein [Escherichia coli]EFO0859513.1 hypothetical protein [Escherichia coli]EFO2431525.1 hypothetical protein [Escherichia coli]